MLKCACSKHTDNSVTTTLCPLHATDDPCLTVASITGKRRVGSIRLGICSNCGWMA